MYSVCGGHFHGTGFPIRISPDQSLCSGSPKLFAATYVLHRLLVPRHPPYALNNLAFLFPKDACKRHAYTQGYTHASLIASTHIHSIFKDQVPLEAVP